MNKTMNYAGVLAALALFAACGHKDAADHQSFASQQEAVDALVTAFEAKDAAELRKISVPAAKS